MMPGPSYQDHDYKVGDYVWVTSYWPSDGYEDEEKAVILHVYENTEYVEVLVNGYSMRVARHAIRPVGSSHPMSTMTKSEKMGGNGPGPIRR